MDKKKTATEEILEKCKGKEGMDFLECVVTEMRKEYEPKKSEK